MREYVRRNKIDRADGFVEERTATLNRLPLRAVEVYRRVPQLGKLPTRVGSLRTRSPGARRAARCQDTRVRARGQSTRALKCTGSACAASQGIGPITASAKEAVERRPDAFMGQRLTVRLRGRTEAPDGAEGAQFLSARGAKPTTPHGFLQRLLHDASAKPLIRCSREQ